MTNRSRFRQQGFRQIEVNGRKPSSAKQQMNRGSGRQHERQNAVRKLGAKSQQSFGEASLAESDVEDEGEAEDRDDQRHRAAQDPQTVLQEAARLLSEPGASQAGRSSCFVLHQNGPLMILQ